MADQSQSESAASAPQAPRPYLDLSRVSLPTQVRIEDRELEVADLDDRQKLLIVDLARIDKEINDQEYSLRILRAAKAELSRLFSAVSKPGEGEAETGS